MNILISDDSVWYRTSIFLMIHLCLVEYGRGCLELVHFKSTNDFTGQYWLILSQVILHNDHFSTDRINHRLLSSLQFYFYLLFNSRTSMYFHSTVAIHGAHDKQKELFGSFSYSVPQVNSKVFLKLAFYPTAKRFQIQKYFLLLSLSEVFLVFHLGNNVIFRI